MLGSGRDSEIRSERQTAVLDALSKLEDMGGGEIEVDLVLENAIFAYIPMKLLTNNRRRLALPHICNYVGCFISWGHPRMTMFEISSQYVRLYGYVGKEELTSEVALDWDTDLKESIFSAFRILKPALN